MGRATLERGIRFTVVSHTINDFRPLHIFLDHSVYGIGIILQVGIHGNRGINIQTKRPHQASEQGILMSPIVGCGRA